MNDRIVTKIIFLDVDGVLNSKNTKAMAPSGCMGVMDSKVRLLKKIVNETNAKIVLSSDWRICYPDNPDYKYLINKLKYKGGIKLYGKTPDISWRERGKEILAWLEKHPKIESWVVIDDIFFDDFSRIEFKDHVIITDDIEGLTVKDAEKAIFILTT